jgi:predicted acyl esterase
VKAWLDQLASDPPPVLATIFAVQPGLDVAQVDGWTDGELLINLAAEWCWSFQANFQLIGSRDEVDE